MSERKRRLLLLTGVLLVLAGAAVKAYPFVSNWYREYVAEVEIQGYSDAIEKEAAESLTRMKEQAAEYNKELGSDGGGVSAASYNDLLAVTDSIGFLDIPKLGIYLPVYHGTEEDVLEKGIGHMPGTSLPVGGASTHCVLSGHTGLPSAKMFTHLDEMEEGDLFYIHVLDEVLAYEVDKISVVLPEETDGIQIEEGKDYVTLLTCIPYGVNSHRLLVRGERTTIEDTPKISVQAPKQEIKEKKIPPKVLPYIMGAGAGILLMIICIVILRIPGKKTGKGKDEDQ